MSECIETSSSTVADACFLSAGVVGRISNVFDVVGNTPGFARHASEALTYIYIYIYRVTGSKTENNRCQTL